MDNEIIDLLRTVASSFQMRMKEQIALSDASLSAFQARLINLIGRHDGISQLMLGSLTERDKAQIARAINELEASGLVTRSLNESDKRSKCLTLTRAGRGMHLGLNAIRGQLAAEALSGLVDNEKQALLDALQKVAARLHPKS
jgi:DNA-binding MarR family transcriptional regulator